jgi:hypothetical protein
VEVQPDDAAGLAVGAVALEHLATTRHPLASERLDELASLVAVHDELAHDDAVDGGCFGRHGWNRP